MYNIADMLVKARAITPKQLNYALQIQNRTGKKLNEILIAEGIITAEQFIGVLSTQLNLPRVFLSHYNPMPEAIKLVSKSIAERLHVIPLRIENGQLFIAMSDPLNLLAQDEVRTLTSRDLKIGITTQEDIDSNLERLYNLQRNLENAIIEAGPGIQNTLDNDFEARPDDAAVVQLVENLLKHAIQEKASDIHIEAYEREARVRLRIDGRLYNTLNYPVELHSSVVARLKIMSRMNITERRRPQDGRSLLELNGQHIDLRVNALPMIHGEKVVLRILDQNNTMIGFEKLGLNVNEMDQIEKFCNLPWGMVLVTGPTGCGKSTTLYSMLQRINSPDVNIVTVEDPVEYTLPSINQVSLRECADLTFESALRAILRQDPDKIMIGEIRDYETAQIAIRAALTGHFVLSTLHTNDAPSAVTRMVDMGIEPFLVSSALSGLMAQRLVRKLCPLCREEYELPPNTCESLHLPVGTHAWRPVGCSGCRNGYRGRQGIFEILEIDDEFRNMISTGATTMALRSRAIEKGMKSLRQSGINAALAGITSLEEVLTTTL